MASDDLKTFKISDQVKPAVGQSQARAKAKGAPAQAEPASVGFPMIEALVESDAPDISGLNTRLEQLTALQSESRNNKEKAGAKKAVIAYERTIDLLQYLLDTKSALNAPAE